VPDRPCGTIQASHLMSVIDRRRGKPLGIAVHDHIIVGKDGHASLTALKLIQSR